ncbi:MAG: response regulator transcription factor, partial [Actinobacteria bacterium]|nr:response regulator transcription factor [Actinomycetota bacterium]
VLSVIVCAAAREAQGELVRVAAGIAGVGRVHAAPTMAQLLRCLRTAPADVALVDAHAEGADAARLRRALTAAPGTTLFVLGSPQDSAAMAWAMAAGARGFLRRGISRGELAVALAHASAAGPHGSPAGDASVPAVRLSAREVQVLQAMATGKTNAEIGGSLFLSVDTVKTHAQRLYRKLEARDRAHAVARGFRLGLVW